MRALVMELGDNQNNLGQRTQPCRAFPLLKQQDLSFQDAGCIADMPFLPPSNDETIGVWRELSWDGTDNSAISEESDVHRRNAYLYHISEESLCRLREHRITPTVWHK